MSNNVIVIGPDKTGKTTLVKSLRESLPDWEVRKFSKTDSAREALQNALKTLCEFDNARNHLYDRFHYPDDLIYRPIVDGEDVPHSIIHTYRHEIVPMLQEYNFKIIYCTAPPDIISERFVTEREENARIMHIPDLLAAYDRELSRFCPLPHTRLNSGVLSKEEMLSKALDFIKRN